MAGVQDIIQTRLSYVRRNINTVTSFITQPKGVFETLDEVVKNVRSANRATIREIESLVGTAGRGRLLGRLRNIIGRIRQRLGR